MKRDNFKKGKIGEEAVAVYLLKKGYQVVERNYRTRYGEIDIICEKGILKGSEPLSSKPALVFVEVKTKTGERFGEPWEMVDRRKLEQVRRIATMYIKNKQLGEPLCRIDVIGVWLDGSERVEKLEHWENVT